MAKGSVQGREKLTALERKLAPQANLVGVNGDLSAPTGRPQGLFLRDGVMQTQPIGSRSSLGIDASERFRSIGSRSSGTGAASAPGAN